MKARFPILFIVLLAALGLAGCFTSDEPLITDETATAPYAKITFAEEGSPKDKTTFVREGKAYVAKTDSGTVTMHFKALGDDLYLAQSAGEQDSKILRLYALIKLDPKKHLAMTYKSMAGEGDAGPGLPNCRRDDMDAICIEDVDAYVALAKAAIAAGAKPDTTYNVTFE